MRPDQYENINSFGSVSFCFLYWRFFSVTDRRGPFCSALITWRAAFWRTPPIGGLSCFVFHFRYGTGTLTMVFLDRVFQECLTYDGEMDYKTYLDFVLALENRKEPQALQYFFKLLDVQNKGHLNMFDLNYFFRVFWPTLLLVLFAISGGSFSKLS